MSEMDDAARAMSEGEALNCAIRVGYAAEDFAQSELGRFVSERAEQERAHALERLAKVDPFDGRAVSALQLRVAAVDAALRWLTEAVMMGRQASERMAQLQQTD